MCNLPKDLQERKDEISKNQEIVNAAQQQIYHLVRNCPHVFLNPEIDRLLRCDVCNKSFDWYCPKNPNKLFPVCEYENEVGFEICIHCGEPEERK